MTLPAGNAPMMMTQASQGNPTAMLGLSPIQPVQVESMSTPLTQGASSTSSPFGMWQTPVPWDTLQGWGWGGGPSAGLGGGGGFDFGGGGSGFQMGGFFGSDYGG